MRMDHYTVKPEGRKPCEVRMTLEQRRRCKDACAEFGDPACYELPSWSSDWPEGKAVEPCDNCK